MDDLIRLRKIAMQFEEIYHDGGPLPERPLVRAAILAVAANPYAGRFVDDLVPLMDALGPLGHDMARRLVDALGGDVAMIEGCGQGAIIGVAGELEHGAMWHQPGRLAMRGILDSPHTTVPWTKKIGALGARLDVPVAHLHTADASGHVDAIEVGLADAPRPDEIVVVLAMTTGARIHARAHGARGQG